MVSHKAKKHYAVLPLRVILFLAFLASGHAANTYHVWTNSPANGPGTAWSNAFHTIQAGVDTASAGDTVLVTNGVYDTGGKLTFGTTPSNRVFITQAITVQSVHGPESTFIVGSAAAGGGNGPGAVRGVFLTAGHLSGFTITNGHTATDGSVHYSGSGGGVNMYHIGNGTVTNCTLIGNSADFAGGGAYGGTLNDCTLSDNWCKYVGGGAAGARLNHCTLGGNTAVGDGGGVDECTLNYCMLGTNSATHGGGANESTLVDCTLIGNWSSSSGGGVKWGTATRCTITSNSTDGAGGGSYLTTLKDCTLIGNRANYGGGANQNTLNDCTLIDNRALNGGAGYNATMNNCVLSGNSSTNVGGATYRGTLTNCKLWDNSAGSRGGGSYQGTLVNCTLSGNSAGWRGGGTHEASLTDCIVYFNSAGTDGDNWYNSSPDFSYSCTTPNPGGTGNITNDPQFANAAAGDLHLKSRAGRWDPVAEDWTHDLVNSPCIDTADPSATFANEPLPNGGRLNMGAYGNTGEASKGGPFVVITDPAADTNVYGEVVAYTVTGTVDVSVAGWMVWTNAAAGTGGSIAANTQWQVPSVDLVFGENRITVSGTNVYGAIGSNSVTITRLVEHGPNSPLHYVSTNGANLYPYSNWPTAAHVLQDAVNTASAGDTVIVTNGVYAAGGAVTPGYALSNRVCITRATTVQSVNGASHTFIVGAADPGTTNGPGAMRCVYMTNSPVLSGFTLTNGHTRISGGPIHDRSGGGVLAPDGVLSNCIITGSSAADSGGGSYDGLLNNCILTANSATNGGGSYAGTLNNCTLTANAAGGDGGGSYGGTLNNCIVYDNRATAAGSNYVAGTLAYCCATPLPGGMGNIAVPPQFVDPAGGNYRLASGSPCIDSGSNAYAPGMHDLDDWPRIVDGNGDGTNTVDMGVYEYFGDPVVVITNPPGAMLSLFGENDTFDVAGTNNMWVAGTMWWTNAASGGSGSFVASSAWEATVPLVFGENPITVYATNSFDELDSDSATITRRVEHGPGSAVHYAWTNSPAEAWPYTNWATAAHVLQDAVDAATTNNLVLVTNGVYNTGGAVTPGHTLSNRVCITRPINVRSTSGPSNTFIVGASHSGTNGPNAVRGVYMLANSSLTGFTVSNGHTRVSGNVTYNQSGGGLLMDGGGTVTNCIFSYNAAPFGGGVACYTAGRISQSTISDNTAGYAGGVYLVIGGVLDGCTLTGNVAMHGGGAAYVNDIGTFNNCLFMDNDAFVGGGIICVNGGTLNNCTVAGNSATNNGGGILFHNGGTLNNCVIWTNQALSGGNDIYIFGSSNVFRYTCSSEGVSHGVDGCTTNAPLFMDSAGSDYRLRYGSPCIDTGHNSYSTGTSDRAGRPRILDGDTDGTNTVDMGAYEYDRSVYDSDADGLIDGDELDTYGTSPTNTNTDGDAHTDYEEMVADTDGANSNDYLRITGISINSPIIVTFDSSSNRLYTMDGCTNLVDGNWTHVPGAGPKPGKGGPESLNDTNVPPKGPFYRLEVGL